MPGSEADPRPVDVGARRERGAVGLVDLAPGAGAVAGEALGLEPDDPRDGGIAGQPERLLALEEALIDADAVAEIGDRALLRQRLGDVRGRLAGLHRRADRRIELVDDRRAREERLIDADALAQVGDRARLDLRLRRDRCRAAAPAALDVHDVCRRRPREERGERGDDCGGEKHLNGCVVVVHVPFPPRPFDHGRDGTRARAARRSPLTRTVCNACDIWNGASSRASRRRTSGPSSPLPGAARTGGARSSSTATTRRTRFTSSRRGGSTCASRRSTATRSPSRSAGRGRPSASSPS